MIPKKNNSGHTRLKIDKKAILKRNNYYFALAVVRRFMSDEQLKSFVALYDKHRSGPRTYVPKPSELKLFAEYPSGVDSKYMR